MVVIAVVMAVAMAVAMAVDMVVDILTVDQALTDLLMEALAGLVHYSPVHLHVIQ